VHPGLARKSAAPAQRACWRSSSPTLLAGPNRIYDAPENCSAKKCWPAPVLAFRLSIPTILRNGN
jgi:hypothetical protein